MTAEHGTRASYQQGCKCPSCRQANADHQRDYQRELKRLADIGREAERKMIATQETELQKRYNALVARVRGEMGL